VDETTLTDDEITTEQGNEQGSWVSAEADVEATDADADVDADDTDADADDTDQDTDTDDPSR
jgi:hypothetical protein